MIWVLIANRRATDDKKSAKSLQGGAFSDSNPNFSPPASSVERDTEIAETPPTLIEILTSDQWEWNGAQELRSRYQFEYARQQS